MQIFFFSELYEPFCNFRKNDILGTYYSFVTSNHRMMHGASQCRVFVLQEHNSRSNTKLQRARKPGNSFDKKE